jgi:hypothetical protein
MRKIFCFRLLYIMVPFFFHSAQAQSDHFAFAVTAINKGGSEWVAFRKIDTRSGDFSDIILSVPEKNKDLINPSVYQVNIKPANNAQPIAGQQPTPGSGNSVAAIAYDRKRNRLYFSPMNTDQLRYIDLFTMQINTSLDQYFSKAGKYEFKYGGPINRLVIAPDDYGYTITTDGNHLIRFTTSESPTLADLGALIDDPLNKEMSIHNPCTNAGGDLVADDAGHLYLICGSNKVFKVDIDTRVASYLATIAGLPEKFTTSGAAVNEFDKLIVGSSVYSDGYFIVDPETWIASPARSTHEIYGSADLANSNLLHAKDPTSSNLFWSKSPEKNNQIRIFPNPLLFDEVSVQFNGLPPGNYTIQLANVLGKKVIQKKVAVTGPSKTEVLHIPHFAAQGFYYVHILDEKNKVIDTQKLVVERW